MPLPLTTPIRDTRGPSPDRTARIVSPKRTNARKLIGRTFGRLTVEAETERRAANGCIIWRCRCKCGGIAEVSTHNLTADNTLSCGCVQVERSRKPNAKRK